LSKSGLGSRGTRGRRGKQRNQGETGSSRDLFRITRFRQAREEGRDLF
jgi:hypothetical protein